MNEKAESLLLITTLWPSFCWSFFLFWKSTVTWSSLTSKSLPQQRHLGELAPCPEHEAQAKRQLPVLQCGANEAPRHEADKLFLKQGRRERLRRQIMVVTALVDTFLPSAFSSQEFFAFSYMSGQIGKTSLFRACRTQWDNLEVEGNQYSTFVFANESNGFNYSYPIGI